MCGANLLLSCTHDKLIDNKQTNKHVSFSCIYLNDSVCPLKYASNFVFLAFLFRMILSVKSEATKSEDMLLQLQEILESVRLAFLNCFLDFAGMVD